MERVNRTIVEQTLCLLFEEKLLQEFQAEAIAAATYPVNRYATKEDNQIPEEAWSGRKPDLCHMRTFG